MLQHISVITSKHTHKPPAESTSKREILAPNKLGVHQSPLNTEWSPYMDIIDEETALQTPPITDIKKSVDVGRSKVYLLGDEYLFLSHNNPCFQCTIAITNFLVSHTCKIRFMMS